MYSQKKIVKYLYYFIYFKKKQQNDTHSGMLFKILFTEKMKLKLN